MGAKRGGAASARSLRQLSDWCAAHLGPHTVGFDADRSLVASCAPGSAAVFTNGERQAVFVQKPDGRVAAQPVFRSEVISGIACDSRRGEIVVTTAHGEERVAVAAASADRRKQRSAP